MSAYRGAWDGGPPGEDAAHIPGAGPPGAAPRTDPWTGASYAPYDCYRYGYAAPYDASHAPYYAPEYYQPPPPAAPRAPSPRSPSPRSPSPRSPSPRHSPRSSPRRRARASSPRRRRRRSSDDSRGRRRSASDSPARYDSDRSPGRPRRRRERSSPSPPRARRRERARSPTPSPPRSSRPEPAPPRKPRDSSITPPRSYARGGSASSDRSDRSKSSAGSSPPARRARRRSSSASSSDSGSSASSLRRPARARPGSQRRAGRARSGPPRSRSGPPRSRSGSPRSRSRSPSAGEAGDGSPSDDEQRRGQFTVADRKRFWKIHNYRQERDPKTPPKELKPPPGAVEPTSVDDVEYGVPPDLEGPNFAELLPPPDLALLAPASSSRSRPGVPVIKNDGSFLEMFKKMQEATKKAEEAVKKPEIKKPTLPFIGKRRGGRVLKTGVVKKAKAIDEQTVDNTPKDAWSLYMQEVKKYRETSCEEERKTRPLVK